MTATAPLISTDCGACGMPLRDDVDARAGLDQQCRAQFSYRKISALAEVDRIEANTLIHAIAQNRLRGDELRQAIFRIYELGFTDMAKRIERRCGVAAREGAVTEVLAPLPVAPPPEVVIDIPSPVETLRPLPFEPTQGQAAALTAIREMRKKRGHAVTIIVGYAGVGKTALILFIAHEHGLPTCIAPTGKAALRIREATGIEATTIHRLIYRAIEDDKTGIAKFVRRTPDEIEMVLHRSRMLILDESSMVGPDVWRDVIAVAQQHDLQLVCIGDGFQLPPVQPPNSPPFSILAPEFAQQLGAQRVELTEVLRQAQDSPIIRASMLLRQRKGIHALREIQQVPREQIASVCLAVHQQGGITICHKNVTRFKINAGLRQMLGITDEMPQPGEPLLCLKNTYEVGLVNGETFQFPGWHVAPEQPEAITDRWKPGITELAYFGAVKINGRHNAVLAVEELHGRLTLSMKAISTVAAKWARRENLYCGDAIAPHVAANFGYAFTAHKCVHPDTLVETRHGLQRIRDIADEGRIATADGVMSYRRLVRNPARTMLRITTKDGYSIDVTPDHGVFVWNGDDYVRVEAQHVVPGAFVRLALGAQLDPTKDPVLPATPEANPHAKLYRTPDTLTQSIAELFGLLVADGTITERGAIRLAKRHKEVTDRFSFLLEQTFGLETRYTKNYNDTRAHCEEAHAKVVTDWLFAVGGMAPNNKFVPRAVLEAPLVTQAKFLRGLFEDGTVNVKRGILDHIEWSNCDEAVAATVQTMLLRFGIVSSRRTRWKGRHAQTMLYIYGQNAKRFRDEIGFIATMKQGRLGYPTGRETRYVLPIGTQDKKVVWEALREVEKNTLRRAGTLSRDRVEGVLQRSPAPAVRGLLEAKLAWHHSRVATVGVIEDAPSMCVEVPGVGRFLQNGFDGSNSQGSAWPYVFVVIEPSIRLNEEEGSRWAYTSLTRASRMVAIHLGGF